jgi:hypothetical protein
MQYSPVYWHERQDERKKNKMHIYNYNTSLYWAYDIKYNPSDTNFQNFNKHVMDWTYSFISLDQCSYFPQYYTSHSQPSDPNLVWQVSSGLWSDLFLLTSILTSMGPACRGVAQRTVIQRIQIPVRCVKIFLLWNLHFYHKAPSAVLSPHFVQLLSNIYHSYTHFISGCNRFCLIGVPASEMESMPLKGRQRPYLEVLDKQNQLFFRGAGWEWVHLLRRPLFGLLYQPVMIDVDEYGAVNGMRIGKGNQSIWRKPVTLSTTNPTWFDLGSNLSHQSGKPANSHVIYGMASTNFY